MDPATTTTATQLAHALVVGSAAGLLAATALAAWRSVAPPGAHLHQLAVIAATAALVAAAIPLPRARPVAVCGVVLAAGALLLATVLDSCVARGRRRRGTDPKGPIGRLDDARRVLLGVGSGAGGLAVVLVAAALEMPGSAGARSSASGLLIACTALELAIALAGASALRLRDRSTLLGQGPPSERSGVSQAG